VKLFRQAMLPPDDASHAHHRVRRMASMAAWSAAILLPARKRAAETAARS